MPAQSSLLTLPGLIDCHVHFREPGLEHKATMKTESASALAGGVTTVCEMPNTIPATVTIAALADKVRRADEIKGCDIRFFFGATEESHLQVLRELWTDSSDELKRLKKSCCGLKLYLDHSTGNQKASVNVIEEAFKLCAELKIPVVGHCEDPEMNEKLKKENQDGEISAHSRIRPPESEAKAVKSAIALAKKYGTHFHVAHISTKEGVELVRAAKKSGLPITCEVTPHHLFLTVDDYKTLGTLAKMNPPLRTKEHQDALWKGIADGTIDCVSTDHAPHTLEEKGMSATAISKSPVPPLSAPSGVPGVETMLPLLLTVTNGYWPGSELRTTDHHLTIDDIVSLCFENPNRIFGLGKKKDAAVTVDPTLEWVIRGKDLHSKCGWTPFEGWKVKGKVMKVLA